MPQLIGNSLALTKLGPYGTLGGGGGAGQGAPGEVAVNSVKFDGTNDWLNRGAALTGAVDADTALVSFWFDLLGDDDAFLQFFKETSNHVFIQRLSDNKIKFQFFTPASLGVWVGNTVSTFIASAGWTHFLLAIDASAGKRQLYINDIAATVENVTANAGDIKWDDTEWFIGSANATPVQQLNADMAELYFTNTFLDLTEVANRRKFISGNGKPVDLESDGSGPTGTAPLGYFSGATATWHTNDGSGGGFTENGALTDGSSSPSD